MRRRLYFMLPGVPSAGVMRDELLLAGIAAAHMHYQARDGALPAELLDADTLHHGAPLSGKRLAMLVGGTAGVVAVAFLAAFPEDGVRLSTLAIAAGSLGGALLGAWACGAHGAGLAQRHFERYAERIADGAVLLTIDVAKERVVHISQMITRRHPEVQYGGEEPPLLAFL